MAISRTEPVDSSDDDEVVVVDEAETVVRTTLGVLVMVVCARTEDDEEGAGRDEAFVSVVAPCAPVFEAPNPGTCPEAVGLTVPVPVELDATWVDATWLAVTGQMVVETATTIVVTSPTVQSAAAVGQDEIVDVWEVKIVLVVMGTEALCSSDDVLMMEEPEADEGVTATAAVADVAVAGTGTGLVSEARAELAEASEAVTGQMVVSTTTTTVVSPASLTPVEVPVT